MEKIYRHTFTNVADEVIETHVDLSKVVTVQTQPHSVFFHVYLQGRKEPLELVHREDGYAAFVAAWRVYTREAA